MLGAVPGSPPDLATLQPRSSSTTLCQTSVCQPFQSRCPTAPEGPTLRPGHPHRLLPPSPCSREEGRRSLQPPAGRDPADHRLQRSAALEATALKPGCQGRRQCSGVLSPEESRAHRPGLTRDGGGLVARPVGPRRQERCEDLCPVSTFCWHPRASFPAAEAASSWAEAWLWRNLPRPGPSPSPSWPAAGRGTWRRNLAVTVRSLCYEGGAEDWPGAEPQWQKGRFESSLCAIPYCVLCTFSTSMGWHSRAGPAGRHHPRRTRRARGLPGPAGPGRPDFVRRDLGGHCGHDGLEATWGGCFPLATPLAHDGPRRGDVLPGWAPAGDVIVSRKA
jgi:hypothetical protein